MQSPSSSSSSTKKYIVDLVRKSRAKIRRKMGSESSSSSSCCADNHGDHLLPLRHHHHHQNQRALSSGSRSPVAEKWVHIIPLIVLFCFFALWWFSYPVVVEIKDGRISAVRQMEMPKSLDETRIDLTFLAISFPPFPSASRIKTLENQTAAEPVGKIGR